MKKIKFILILTFLTLGACARHAEQFISAPGKSDFGALIADKNLNLRGLKPVKPATFSNDAEVLLASRDWFTLAELLLENSKANSSLSTLGYELINAFYKIPHSSTSITAMTTPPESPYAEAAPWFAAPILNKKIQGLFESAEEKVTKTADLVTADISDLPKPYPPPEDVLQRILAGLHDFRERLVLQKDGSCDAVINTITNSLDTKYIADIQKLLTSVSWNKADPLSESLKNLENTIGQITEVSDFQRRRLLNQVGLAVALTSENEEIQDPEAFMVFLGDLWLAKPIRKNYPERIKKIFQDLSDKQLFALATTNSPQILQEAEWTNVKIEKDTIPLPDRSLVAIYLENKGDVLSQDDWQSLQDKSAELDDLLDNSEFSDFAKVMANVPSDDKAEQRFALVSGWLAIPERLGIPNQIRDIFKELNEHEVNLLTAKSSMTWNTAETIEQTGIAPQFIVDALSGLDKGVKNITAKGSISLTSTGHFSLTKYRYAIIDALQKPEALSGIKNLFEEAVTQATRERLDLTLIPTANALPSQIKDALIPQLRENSQKNKEKIPSTIDQYGRYYLGKLVFNVKGLKKENLNDAPKEDAIIESHDLPLFENSNLKFSFRDHKWLSSNNYETNSELLGLSLAVLPERLQKMSELHSNPQSQVAVEYEMVSKLLAIAGYHDSHGRLADSLSVAMDKAHWNNLFDIAKYDPAQVVFATPDILKIHNNFKLDPSSRANPSVSVFGQMSLLRGYAHLMKYLKPWFPSLFDSGLGALRVDEEATLEPFNRADFFLLSTGLGVAILKNIPYKMLGLITDDFKFVDGTKVEDPAQISAIGAVLTNYTRDGLSHHVETKNIAQAILAMSEFYEETADLARSTNPMIIAGTEGDKLKTSRDTLQKLIAGMVLFSTSHLMLEDGGFAPGFNLDQMKTDDGTNRVLGDQLLMEEALLEAGRVFDSGFMISRALDNFYFLNNQMWSDALGFYRRQEKDKGEQLSLIDVARGIHIVTEMLSLDVTQSPKPQSTQQMEQLVKLWIGRFFGKETLGLDPVYLLSEFSL